MPETEFALEEGRAVLVAVRMRNNTEWPLKQGCKVCSFFTEETAALLEEVCFPLDQYVAGEQAFEFAIPLKLKEGAALESSKLHTADFKLQGPGGKSFGQAIAIKFRVQSGIASAEFCKRALSIFDDLKRQKEAGVLPPDFEFTFEQVTESLRASCNDAELATALLVSSFVDNKPVARDPQTPI